MSKKSNKRECGDCTLCCQVLPVNIAESPAGVLCKHCTKSGCGIYESRWDICKEFKCLWLTNDKMSDNLRPDLIDVIFEVVTDKIYIGTLNSHNVSKWLETDAIGYIKDLNKLGISVIITSFTNLPKIFMLAEGRTQEEVMKEAMVEYNKEFKK